MKTTVHTLRISTTTQARFDLYLKENTQLICSKGDCSSTVVTGS